MWHIKIGTDICSVKRIQEAYEKHGQRFLDRVLTEKEKDYVQKRANQNNKLRVSRLAEVVAGRFAAKEAVAKALGTGWNGLYWKEVEILNSVSGEPQVKLSGRAVKLLSQRAFKQIDISISHEREFAMATALLY